MASITSRIVPAQQFKMTDHLQYEAGDNKAGFNSDFFPKTPL